MAIYAQNKIATPYMGYYKPVNLYRGGQKVSGWTWAEKQGAAVEFEDTYNDAVHGVISGRSEQNGTPSPSAPIPILSAGGCDLVSADGSKSSSIAMPILRSLPHGVMDTLEYIGGGMWEHVQRVGVKVFDGTETWTKYPDAEHNVYLLNGPFNAENGVKYASRCSHYPWTPGLLLNNQDEHRFQNTTSTPSSNRIYISSSDIGSVADFKTFLAAQYAAGTPVIVQYQLATPITTLLNLGELKTYPHETQIHQDTTGLLADLSLTARVVDKEAE